MATRVKALSLHIFIDLTKSPSEDVGAWLAELLNTIIRFPSLQTLLLYSSSSQIGQSALLTLVQRTASTLSSLTIPYRYLTNEEVYQLLDVLTEGGVQIVTATGLITNSRQSKLKALNMNIFQLSVPFLDLLALKLPHLESLTLVVSEIVGSGKVPFYFPFFPTFNPNSAETLPFFRIHFTIFSIIDGTIGGVTPPPPVIPLKISFTHGNCVTSQFVSRIR